MDKIFEKIKIYNLLLFFESQLEAIEIKGTLAVFILGFALLQQVLKDETVLLHVPLLQLHLYLQYNSLDFDIGADAIKLRSSGVHFGSNFLILNKFIKNDLNIIDKVNRD